MSVSASSHASVVLDDVSFHWPDGRIVLSHVSVAFTAGRIGLIGDNGVGKSTLLRLISGELSPTEGRVDISGEVAVLPQNLPTDPEATVADLAGVRRILDALARLEAGDASDDVYETIGDAWDIDDRLRASFDAAGIRIGSFDRPAATLSGGEAMTVALSSLLARRTPVTLLDEPTNNLDEAGRARVRELVKGWKGTLIVVSHDRELLELMDETAELREGALRLFGGGFTRYREQLDVEQKAARKAAASAEQAVDVARRRRVAAEERIAHSSRKGRKDAADKKFVAAVVNDRRNSAEKSQAARRSRADEKTIAAQAELAQAEAAVRDDDPIRLDLPDPLLPRGRRIASLTGSDGREFTLQGPERVALIGPNGVGKTTLLRELVSSASRDGVAEVARRGGHVDPGRTIARSYTRRIGHLSQDLSSLRPDRTALENAFDAGVALPPSDVRTALARLQLRGAAVERPVSELSGGERLRVALVQLLLVDPPSELLVLDEPTNSLDMRSVRQLVEALSSYRGALLVVSHDREFLMGLGVERVLRLGPDGVLREDPAASRTR